jgi:SAM-dependent methyltransferase
MSETAVLDPDKLNQFVGKFLHDLGATFNASLTIIGSRLGFYRSLAQLGPQTPADLAVATGTAERYVREWLSAQAAHGYVTYDAATGRFSLSPEQAFTLADPAGLDATGAFLIAAAGTHSTEKLLERFRTGDGLGWHEQHQCLFEGTERFFRPSYAMNLCTSWIPALEGVEEKLRRGGSVADVGCGHGSSTILMAKAYPKSTFHGFDYHPASIERARETAWQAGVAERTAFATGAAKDYPGEGYDLVTFFDCLHDMGDPVGAAAHVRKTLAPDGTWMIVEPFANDRLEDNLTPVGAVYYAASTMICTPASLSQEVGLALGAQAGEARIRDVVTRGGFTRFRRAAETPFNLVFEARP